MVLLLLSTWREAGYCEGAKAPLLTLRLWVRWQLAVHMAWRRRQRGSGAWDSIAVHYETWRRRVLSLGMRIEEKGRLYLGSSLTSSLAVSEMEWVLFFLSYHMRKLQLAYSILLGTRSEWSKGPNWLENRQQLQGLFYNRVGNTVQTPHVSSTSSHWLLRTLERNSIWGLWVFFHFCILTRKRNIFRKFNLNHYLKLGWDFSSSSIIRTAEEEKG